AFRQSPSLSGDTSTGRKPSWPVHLALKPVRIGGTGQPPRATLRPQTMIAELVLPRVCISLARAIELFWQVGCRNSRNLDLNETAPRWENHSRSASLRPTSFALASRQQPPAQTAPLARATNLRIKANRVPPPRGFVQEPVPERPQRLAVKPSSACAGPSGTGFFHFSTERPSSSGES